MLTFKSPICKCNENILWHSLYLNIFFKIQKKKKILSEEEDLKLMRCNSLISMGLCFKAMKRFKEAIKLLKKAL